MSNGQSGGGYRKTPEWVYYDQLGPRMRKMLQECVTTWDCKWVLKNVREHGADFVEREIKKAEHKFMMKGHKFKAFEKNRPSSYSAANVKPLKANW